MADDVRNVIIMGSGPAGLTAAIYTGRADLDPLVIEGAMAGGQLTTTTDVENYPGYPEGIMGPAMMDDFKNQAKRFGAEIIFGDITKADLKKKPIEVSVGDKVYKTKTFIISSGASPKFLGLEAEQKYMGRGVSTCATCDGFFYKEKELVVIGGGDSAMEEATFLTKFATKVSLIHRRQTFRASKIMQDRALANKKIEVIYNTVVEEILGDDSGVIGVRLKNVKSDEVTEKKIDGFFLAIGHTPNTQLFKGQIDLDEHGYILTKPDTTLTNIDGVFACGDVQDTRYKQAVTAAGSGCMAAIDTEKYLEHL